MGVKSMVQVQADQATSELLRRVKGRVELVDGSGTIIGYFEQVEGEADQLRKIAFAAYDTGEYQKRKAMSEGDERLTTEQVLERLRSMEAS